MSHENIEFEIIETPAEPKAKTDKNAYMREWRQKNKEKKKEHNARYYDKHKDKGLTEAQLQSREKEKEMVRCEDCGMSMARKSLPMHQRIMGRCNPDREIEKTPEEMMAIRVMTRRQSEEGYAKRKAEAEAKARLI